MAKTADVQVVTDIFDQLKDELLLIEQPQITAVPPVGFHAVVDEGVRVLIARGADESQRALNVGHQRPEQTPALELVRRYLPHRCGGTRTVLVAPQWR